MEGVEILDRVARDEYRPNSGEAVRAVGVSGQREQPVQRS